MAYSKVFLKLAADENRIVYSLLYRSAFSGYRF